MELVSKEFDASKSINFTELVKNSNTPQKKTINETELFGKYKSSYKSAFLDFSLHTFNLSCSFYLLWLVRNSWLSCFAIPIMALMIDRTFMIFHDCCHQSYTPNKTLNYIISHITGTFVLTSPNWILDHHTHHLTNGNTENKHNFKFNELVYTTKKQYDSFSTINKYIYSFIHHPIIFFNIIAFVYFFGLQRFIYVIKKIKYNQKINSSIFVICMNHLINNLLLYTFCKVLLYYDIFVLFFISHQIASILGFLLFFNQHTFNPPYVVNNETWKMKDSGLLGSSFIQIPYLLKYFTMGIEYHHIHHINAKIPGYNLQKYHEEVITKSSIFNNIVKLDMSDCYNNLWLALYDEDKKQFITFDNNSIDDVDIQNQHMKNRCYFLTVICGMSLYSWYNYSLFDPITIDYYSQYYQNCLLCNFYLCWDTYQMIFSQNKKVLFRKELLIHHILSLFVSVSFTNYAPLYLSHIFIMESISVMNHILKDKQLLLKIYRTLCICLIRIPLSVWSLSYYIPNILIPHLKKSITHQPYYFILYVNTHIFYFFIAYDMYILFKLYKPKHKKL
jgi:omega-6 fatty acid desaturase (delta-12 desaturase)